MRALITGVNGFVGQHLARELKKRGDEVVGTGLNPKAEAAIADLLNDYWRCDLSDAAAVDKLELANIEVIYSLAGLANVGASYGRPGEYIKTNVDVAANLARTLVAKKSSALFVAVSSGTVYEPAQPMPLREESALAKDGSPYAQSKMRMEEALHELTEEGLRLVIVRPFNHAGPGQEAGFIIPDLYDKLMLAKKTGQISVGNLKSRRDYTDVRDVVRAYADLGAAKQRAENIYNVCSSQATTGQTILDLLIKDLGIQKIEIVSDHSLLRPNDPPEIYGSSERLQMEIGWRPTIGLEQTIKDFVASKR